jgi:hypothetical protein
MTALSDWLTLRDDLTTWRDEWDNCGVVQIRLSDGRLMLIDDAVPDTRGDCPTVKPCPHVRCRYHLWRIDGGENGTRPGRPGIASVPRDASGLTLRVEGDLGGERPGTTLEARWLETPVAPSCALDEAARAHSNAEVGYRINRHRTMAGRDVPKAIEEGKRAAARMGMTAADFLRGLRELGAGL